MPLPGVDDDLFAWLVAPVSRETFFADHFRRKPLLVQQRGEDYYQGLFDLDDLERIAYAAPDGVASCLQLIADRDRLSVQPGPLLGQLRSAFERGYTIQVESVGRFAPAVAHLQRRLEAFIAGQVHFNLYFSPPGAKAFPAHADHHDAIVLQLRGRKHWKVYEDHPELVSASLRREDPPPPERIGPPLWTPTLGPGDLLYLPLGHFHEAHTSDEPSLHVTIGLYPYNAGALLLDTLRECAATEAAFLQPVSAWPPEARARHVRDLLDRLASAVDVDARLARHQAALVASMPLLPGDLFAERLSLERIDQTVRKRPGMVCTVGVDSERAAIHFPGGGLTAPLRAEEALRFVAGASGPFRPMDLPDGLPDDSKLLLVRRLIGEGLLVVCE